ncbi:MAG: hypothetical protein AAF604_19895 [Acidobacteriota bacterium]
MAEQDFLGVWRVWLTAGIPFGLGTEITIDSQNGVLSVTTEPEVGEGLQITYWESDDQMRITGLPMTPELVLAHYRDPDPTIDYRALYGAALMEATDLKQSRLALCYADHVADTTTSTSGERQAPTNPWGNDQIWKVQASSGSQFGIGSTVTLGEGNSVLSISNVFGEAIPPVPTMQYVAESGALRGELPANEHPRIVVQCSIADFDGDQRIFGVGVIGDPEASGVWGGDEEDPPQGEDR